jgi:hypothetical protein
MSSSTKQHQQQQPSSILSILPDPSTIVLASHFLLLVATVTFFLRILRSEVLKALEAWQQLVEEDEEKSMVWQSLDRQRDVPELKLGATVCLPGIGRGIVTAFDIPTKGDIQVTYDVTEEARVHSMHDPDLLCVGMEVSHPQRGHGVIRRFDDDRVHVEFDNGEYHRYKHDTWKKKIAPSTRHRNRVRTLGSKRAFIKAYLLYRSDYTLSTFTFAKPVLLLIITYILILLGAVAYSYASGKSMAESLWVSWTMVADPGTHADAKGTILRGVSLILTVGGMLVFALMIGIIADGVSSLLDSLKQGESNVIESGHTLILGWSDKALPLIREIALANESEGGGTIVVLANRPKAEMENELRKELSSDEARGTLVICRSGSPTNQADLRKVSANAARSIIVLAVPNTLPDESDALAVRVVLSLLGIRKSKMGHVVVELCDVDNRDLVLLADHKNVEVIVAHDLIGRLMIQCARQPGLAQVLDEILGFEGDEFYIKEWEELQGLTFSDVMFRFEDAIVLGVKPRDRHDCYKQILESEWRKNALQRRGLDGELVAPPPREKLKAEASFALRGGSALAPIIDHFAQPGSPEERGQPVFSDDEEEDEVSREVVLNPPDDYIIRPGDAILVLAEDDDSYAPRKSMSEMSQEARDAFTNLQPAHRPVVMNQPEKLLFCGWRRDMDDMIMELDALLGPGSELTIMSTVSESVRAKRLEEGGLDVRRLKNLKLHHVEGNPILRRDLDKLKLREFSSVLILADESLEADMASADSRSLAGLLVVRDLIAKQNRQRLKSKPSNRSLMNMGNMPSGIMSPNSVGPSLVNNNNNTTVSVGIDDGFSPPMSPTGSKDNNNNNSDHSSTMWSNPASGIPSTMSDEAVNAIVNSPTAPPPASVPPTTTTSSITSSLLMRPSLGVKQLSGSGLFGSKKKDTSAAAAAAANNNTTNNGEKRPTVGEMSSGGSGSRISFSNLANTKFERQISANSSNNNNSRGNATSPTVNIVTTTTEYDINSPTSHHETIITSNNLKEPSLSNLSATGGFGGGFGGGPGQGMGPKRLSNLGSNRGWRPNTLARRPSSVGADLFFENAKDVGGTVLISEILDSRTKALIPIARVGDHVLSNEIVAATLAMVSEDRLVNVVLSELLQAEGNDLHIRSALDYGTHGAKVTFWELMARARARGEIAIGYKLAGEKNAVLNPRDKAAKIPIGARGTVIVISED